MAKLPSSKEFSEKTSASRPGGEEHGVTLPAFRRESTSTRQATRSVSPRKQKTSLPSSSSLTHPAGETPKPQSFKNPHTKPVPNAKKLKRLKKRKKSVDNSPNQELAPILNDLQERRQLKHWRIRSQRLRSLAKLAMCLILIGGLSWGVQHLPIQGFPAIELANTPQLTPQTVITRKLDYLTEGAPFSSKQGGWLLLSPEKLSTRLEHGLPFVEHISLSKRILPNRWVVGIQETLPWAIIHTPQALAPLKEKANDIPPERKAAPNNTTKGENSSTLGITLGVVLPNFNRVWVSQLSPDEKAILAEYITSPAQPLAPIIAETPNQLTQAKWQQVYTLAKWLQRLPGWHTALIDIRTPNNIVIRPKEGPAVLLGPLNRQWPERFRRLGPMLAYWPQWQGKIESVDLRWPTQITLHPKQPLNTLPKDWPQQLGAAPPTSGL